MSKVANCANCKAPAKVTTRPWQLRKKAPLEDSLTINCPKNCMGGFTGRNRGNMIEEWNETQRVLLENEAIARDES